ncbi:MAG: nuclear transport factor 2 family protein [Burkholderiales bacterium]
MTTTFQTPELDAAIQSYFDVLHECDLEKFDRLFLPACSLFTVADGTAQVLSASTYRELLATRSSPKSLGQPREESVIASLALSNDIALVRVRVRIGSKVYRDHLNFVRSQGVWKLAAKLYVVEPSPAEQAAAPR